jgi:uncharacterized protein YjbI with pentapeptide repeats
MIESILSLTPEQKRRVDVEIGPLRSVTEFCSDLLDASKELPLKERLAELLPWAAKGGQILSEVTPLTKVLVKLVGEVTKEKDPETLGLLAGSLAYQRSAALALVQQGEPSDRVPFEHSLQSAKENLKKLKVRVDLAGFSLEAPLAHPFVWQADDGLSLVVRSTGYTDSEWRQIQLRVHDQFRADLSEVLSHGETATYFEPFTTRLSLGDDTAAYAALNAHIDRQRWLFEGRRVLNIEPFTLDDVYVDTDCGKLRWKDFLNSSDSKREASGEKLDPFSENFGGRHPLLETVLDYLRDPKFNDAIVIQGAPGCGKSSFTLRLANVLRREGLRPLRIRLKFLDLKKNLSDALAQVVLQPEEDDDRAQTSLPRCSDPFLNGSIFQERTRFGDAQICPYVLILDGWDEISVAVNEGFEKEVSRMLDHVRSEFLSQRTPKVGVILTGRPSYAVERSLFLRDDTPLLTVRDYTPDQLENYADKVKGALARDAMAVVEGWSIINWHNVESVITSYRSDRSKLDILGLPLLAHLSLRLLVQWNDAPEALLSNRTTLYRHLLDVTCIKAGKALSDSDDLYRQARIRGLDLRRMLQQTAVAITAYGSESIPFGELRLRLKKNRKQTMEAAERAGTEHPLTSLMISFYFKGGREHLGCEFLHKSFREYLYAEAIVETLKEYGRKQSGSLLEREPYWKDFQESDPRRQLSHDLGRFFCPYPLSVEISNHVASLLEWEIERSRGKAGENQIGQLLDAVTFAQWLFIRDSLVALWDWWGEGVHLRPQPYRDASDTLLYRPAFVNELIDYSLPRDRGPDALEWSPSRLVNADANLGAALCQLNVWVHAFILELSEWSGILANREGRSPNSDQRPWQSEYQLPHAAFMLFRPSGSSPVYFRNYCSRINAAGNRAFPSAIDLSQVDLSGADLHQADLRQSVLRQADLSRAVLHQGNLNGADLSGADLRETDLSKADLRQADLHQAELIRAALHQANLRGADLSRANLREANLSGADLSQADLRLTYLRSAVLHEANLGGANLSGANLREARLSGVDLRGADLRRADLSGAVLSRANLRKADLSGADLSGTDLSRADLSEANLSGAVLSEVLGIDQDQLNRARGDTKTKRPEREGLTGQESWF